MIRTPFGIVSVKGFVARKSSYFTKNANFAYIEHVVQKSSYFISLITKIYFLSIMFCTLLPSINIKISGDVILIRQVLPENHALYLSLKWQFCLGPIAKYMHFSTYRYFVSLMTNVFNFFHVLSLSPQL